MNIAKVYFNDINASGSFWTGDGDLDVTRAVNDDSWVCGVIGWVRV